MNHRCAETTYWLLLLVSLSTCIHAQTNAPMTSQDTLTPTQVAESYVNSFKDGKEFAPPADGLIQYGAPDTQALFVLERHLSEGGVDERANIVELLADIGVQCADPSNIGLAWINERRVIRILACVGTARPDLARERSMYHLRHKALPNDLALYAPELARAVEERPTEDGLLLAAKMKAKEFRALISDLSDKEEWQNDPALNVARAAFGDDGIEQRIQRELTRAAENGDVVKFEEAIGSLSLIGTPMAMKAVAEQLRTPLIREVARSNARSLRLVVLDGLMYARPDQILLYPDNIIEDEDYLAAEKFCEREFGAVYSTPRPPFMTYKGYPSGGKR